MEDMGVVRALPLCFILFTVVGHVHSAVVYVETGTNHTFLPKITGKQEAILWKYKQNKLVEFDSTGETWYRFKGRGSLNYQTGDLILQHLNKNESGVYDSEIQVNGQLQYSSHDVKVIDAISEPVVKCKVNDTERKLHCSAESSTILKWSGPDAFEFTGDSVLVPKTTDLKSVYICTAENELGNKAAKSTLFSLEKCDTDIDDNTAVIVGVSVGVILAIGLVIVAFFICPKIKDGYKKVATNQTDPEGQPLENLTNGAPENKDPPVVTSPDQTSATTGVNLQSAANNLPEKKEQDDGRDKVETHNEGKPEAPTTNGPSVPNVGTGSNNHIQSPQDTEEEEESDTTPENKDPPVTSTDQTPATTGVNLQSAANSLPEKKEHDEGTTMGTETEEEEETLLDDEEEVMKRNEKQGSTSDITAEGEGGADKKISDLTNSESYDCPPVSPVERIVKQFEDMQWRPKEVISSNRAQQDQHANIE